MGSKWFWTWSSEPKGTPRWGTGYKSETNLYPQAILLLVLRIKEIKVAVTALSSMSLHWPNIRTASTSDCRNLLSSRFLMQRKMLQSSENKRQVQSQMESQISFIITLNSKGSRQSPEEQQTSWCMNARGGKKNRNPKWDPPAGKIASKPVHIIRI
jgi:hypothetical protein